VPARASKTASSRWDRAPSTGSNSYRQESRPALQNDPGEPTLFLTDQGQRFRRSALSARVKRLLQRAGIDRPGSCHLFRHACATHMLQGGADIRVIQALLGHQSLETTQLYTHVALDHLTKIHAATHPLVTVEPDAPPDPAPDPESRA
jgi:integrase/recombinase XerD